MNDLKTCIIGGIILFVLVWLLRRNTASRTSNFTFQPFEGLSNPTEVVASYRLQSQQIADELKTDLIKAKAEKKTKEEMVAISDKFSDYSYALGKAFARWNINNAM